MTETDKRIDLLDKLGIWLNPALILSLLALVFTLWQWWHTHNELHRLREEVSQHLHASDTAAQQARLVSQQTADATRDLTLHVADLETRLAESQSQQAALEALYRNMSQSRDEWTLSDIEQLLLGANQQLQLDGNVKAAIIALQDADTRLQAMNRPQFTPLRRALNTDIARLQSVPQVDTVGITLRLDTLIAQVDTLPLSDEHATPARAAPQASPVPVNATQRFALELWRELKNLVQIRRLDTPDTALLLPDQSYFLRQNLKLRLLSARIALLTHDPVSYQADLQMAGQWITRYFNTNDAQTHAALLQIDKLLHSPISVPLPNLDASMAALQASHLTPDR